MSAAVVTTGFFGKIPATGDFVTRNLPAGFVRDWDLWVTRHLVPLQAEIWPGHIALRFLFGSAPFGPTVGLVMPSADSVGRRFPLTVAARPGRASIAIGIAAAPWFDAVKNIMAAARAGEINADEFAAELAQLPAPEDETEGPPVSGMVFWLSPGELIAVDRDAPRAALKRLLTMVPEIG